MRDVVWWRGEGEGTRAIEETFRGRAYREMSCRVRLQGTGLYGKSLQRHYPQRKNLLGKGLVRT